MKAKPPHSIPAGNAAPRRQAHHFLLFGLRQRGRKHWRAAVAAVGTAALATGMAGWLLTQIDWAKAAKVIAGLPTLPLLVAMSALPLIGFPILPVYLVAGARFGPWGGGVAVTLATAIHLVGSSIVARTVLRRPLHWVLTRWHAHLPAIPEDEQASVALIAALVPGLPYVIRNYLLAFAELRLRIYFWICLPIYVARSYVSILVGDLSGAPDRARLAWLGAIELLKVAVCALVLWRLRAHHLRYHSGAQAVAPRPVSA